MIEHAKTLCKSYHIDYLLIFADPFAKEFYNRKGAEYLYDSASSIPDRKIPIYQLKTN